MNVTVKPLEKSEVEITVTLPWEEWKKYREKAFENIAKDVKLPGFRPGKVPREVIEKKYGKEAIVLEAADIAVQMSYPEVLRTEKLDTIGRPKADIHAALEGEPLQYVIVSAIVPKATLRPWKDAVHTVNARYADEKTEVSEEEADKEVQKLAESRAALITVNRAAASGDAVEVDFQVFRDKVLIENGTGRNHPIVLGSNTFIPGFEEHIIGMKADEETSFELSFPSTYHAKDLAGQKALFQVKLGLVQERKIPEMNDEFARSVGKFDTLVALKTALLEGIREEKRQQSEEKHRADIAEALAEVTDIVLPQVMIDEETHTMIREFEGRVQGMGMNLDEYLKGMNKTHEDLHKDWAPQATKRLIIAASLEEVARELEIETAAEEIEAEMNKTLQYYKSMQDLDKKLDLEKLYAFTKSRVQNEKVFEALLKM